MVRRALPLLVCLAAGCLDWTGYAASDAGPPEEEAMSAVVDMRISDMAVRVKDLAVPHDLARYDGEGPACRSPNDCPPIPNTILMCGGTCQVENCIGVFADCDGNEINGCESESDIDPANCGKCGVSCLSVANGTGACQRSTCVIGSCAAGFANCDNDFSKGCSVVTTTDPNNCGGCGNPCAIPYSINSCVNSVCVSSGCVTGFADCDHSAANGCEVATLGDSANCGGCGMVCPTSTPVCEGGVCSVEDFPEEYLIYVIEHP